tara:strand:+ start:1016 stop:1774 length:759 start_codon:yes stop_codon:yes gene_type:complete
MPPKREPKPDPEPEPEPEPESGGFLDRVFETCLHRPSTTGTFISATPRRAQFNQIMNTKTPRVRKLDISTPTNDDLNQPLYDRLREIHENHRIPGDPKNNYLWLIHEDIIDINDNDIAAAAADAAAAGADAANAAANAAKIEKIDEYLNSLAKKKKLKNFRTYGPDGVLFNINGREINITPESWDHILIQRSSQQDVDRIKSQETHPTPRPTRRSRTRPPPPSTGLKGQSKRKKKKTRKKKKKTKKKTKKRR